MIKFKKVSLVFFTFVFSLIFIAPSLDVSAHIAEHLEVNEINPESLIDMNSAPRSIHQVALKAMYYGPYVYHEEYAYGTRYRGYLYFDYSALNICRYSGTLYRIDLPDYPIPSNIPIELEVN